MLNSKEVKDYLSHHHLPQLLESLLTGLLYHHPEDPISFLHSCLITTTQLGGPEAVTWDTFIHLGGQQLSHGPSRTTYVPTKATTKSTRRASVPPKTTSVLPRTASVTPRTTPLPSIIPQIPQTTSRISPSLMIIPRTASVSPIKPSKVTPLPQTSALFSQPAIPKCQTISPLLQTTPPRSPTSAPKLQIIPPITTTTTAALPSSSGPQTPPMKPKITVLPPLKAQVSLIDGQTVIGPPQITSQQLPLVLHQAQSGTEVIAPAIFNERKEEPETVITGGLPPSPARSQLSIDSDSDMTESSGLLQEVSIKPHKRPRPIIIFIIGGPGSGKGTQAGRLARGFNLKVISLNDLLRRQLLSQASPSKKWDVISQMMCHGELGPQTVCLQEETISELRRQMIGQQEAKGFIVDGFPRDVHQALSFQEQIGSPDSVMLLLCSNETLRCRLQRRATELGLLGDSSHAFRKRLDTFQRDIISVRRYYKQLKLLSQVDGDRDEDQVFADLSSVIRKKMPQKESSDPADIPECSNAVPPVTSTTN
ncbi:uncharacterized protein LOC141790046 [Halichoeres trimaculatus]|uniref:uncharacterized protein LOC141790046 n=1 Tax=Halichoeres trimaculatus TaxID=147232 RepID=UPI003D9F5314